MGIYTIKVCSTSDCLYSVEADDEAGAKARLQASFDGKLEEGELKLVSFLEAAPASVKFGAVSSDEE